MELPDDKLTVFAYRDQLMVNHKVYFHNNGSSERIILIPESSTNHMVLGTNVSVESFAVTQSSIAVHHKDSTVTNGISSDSYNSFLTVKDLEEGLTKSFPERNITSVVRGLGGVKLVVQVKNLSPNASSAWILLDVMYRMPLRGSWDLQHHLDMNGLLEKPSMMTTTIALGDALTDLCNSRRNSQSTLIDELTFIDKYLVSPFSSVQREASYEIRPREGSAKAMSRTPSSRSRESFDQEEPSMEITKNVEGLWVIKDVKITRHEKSVVYKVQSAPVTAKATTVLGLCETYPRLMLTFTNPVGVDEGELSVRLANGQMHHGRQMLRPTTRRVDMGLTTGVSCIWKKTETRPEFVEYQVDILNRGSVVVPVELWIKGVKLVETVKRVNEDNADAGVKTQRKFSPVKDDLEKETMIIVPAHFSPNASLLRLRVYS